MRTLCPYTTLFRSDHTRLTSFFESAKEEGLEVQVQVKLAEVLPAKLNVARALNMEEGEQVTRIKTLRIVSQLPVTVHDAYIPYKLFPNIVEQDLTTKTLWDVIESYGYRVKRAVQHVEAREADEEISAFLDVEEGFPILFKERTVYLDNGTPVEFTYCYNRGDRYRLTVLLER
jgi:GntR family transcriptional regulator